MASSPAPHKTDSMEALAKPNRRPRSHEEGRLRYPLQAFLIRVKDIFNWFSQAATSAEECNSDAWNATLRKVMMSRNWHSASSRRHKAIQVRGRPLLAMDYVGPLLSPRSIHAVLVNRTLCIRRSFGVIEPVYHINTIIMVLVSSIITRSSSTAWHVRAGFDPGATYSPCGSFCQAPLLHAYRE